MGAQGAEALFHELRLGGGPTTGRPLRLRAVASGELGVLERFVSDGPGVPVQVVTGYRALPTPPPSYPEGIPFVPGVPVFITEFPEAWSTPSVRWLVERDDTGVFERVLSACLAGGWRRVEGMGELLPFPGRRVVLRRRSEAWLVLEQELAGGRTAVQLLGMV